ncbi:VanZ family protein [Candidatus Thiosymbion oneisti]|uniref:VanZ family protein n=1 Tax=Candidatus Thiosymbion oneisti TaxID=589554 RepID=UPI000B7C96CA|nr:VanZ family protein [Candidatus Thiosymbion oneisti]
MIGLLTIIKTNWLAFTLFTLVVITFLSLWPLDELPSVPGTDKAHHIIAYAILVLPTALRKPNRWLLFALFFIAHGGAIELLQPYVNRYGEWLDMLANTAGVVCGFIIAEIVNFFFPVIPNRSR